jgi:hypothetical protein
MGRLVKINGMRFDYACPGSQQTGVDNEYHDYFLEDEVNEKCTLINRAYHARLFLYRNRRSKISGSALAKLLDDYSDTLKRIALSGD